MKNHHGHPVDSSDKPRQGPEKQDHQKQQQILHHLSQLQPHHQLEQQVKHLQSEL